MKKLNICIDIDGTITEPYYWLDCCNKHFKTNITEKDLTLITHEYLRNNSIHYDNLFLLGSHYKVNKAKELDCDIFIEDNYRNAIELSEAGFYVLLLDTNYNREPLNNNIKRVYKNIKNLFLEMEVI